MASKPAAAKDENPAMSAAPASAESAPAPASAPAASNGQSMGAPDSAPAGFRRRVSISEAPWVAQVEGNVVYGRLLNRYEMQNQTPRRWYYQIELHAPCQVRIGKGDDAELAKAAKGDVVNLNENYKLTGLRDVEIPSILAEAVYDIWLKYENKVKIAGGRTMWNIDMQTKQLKAPTRPITPLPASDLGEAEDTPF